MKQVQKELLRKELCRKEKVTVIYMVTSNGGIEYRSNQKYTVIILGGHC